jgi:predicted TIM-barrel fold metal-dependent hydrolase
MIIDADTHISPTGEDAMAITIDDLLRRMDRAGVNKALTWLRPPYLREIDESNAYVHQAMQQHPDRILGFGWADPRLGLEKAGEVTLEEKQMVMAGNMARLMGLDIPITLEVVR